MEFIGKTEKRGKLVDIIVDGRLGNLVSYHTMIVVRRWRVMMRRVKESLCEMRISPFSFLSYSDGSDV
jgi:hypothetical protein